MDSFELNKIFAAVLCAAITAMMGWFIADLVIHPKKLKKNAVEIEGAALVGGGPVKPKLPDPILHLIAEADITKGARLSKACAACHSFDQGGPHKVGPNLYKIVGAPIGGKDGFGYSSAMANYGGAWSYADLNKFFWKPKRHMPGTKMNYAGLKKPEDRAAMIAWLRTQGSSGFPLPSAADIADEIARFAPPEAEEAVEDAVEKAVEGVQEGAGN